MKFLMHSFLFMVCFTGVSQAAAHYNLQQIEKAVTDETVFISSGGTTIEYKLRFIGSVIQLIRKNLSSSVVFENDNQEEAYKFLRSKLVVQDEVGRLMCTFQGIIFLQNPIDKHFLDGLKKINTSESLAFLKRCEEIIIDFVC